MMPLLSLFNLCLIVAEVVYVPALVYRPEEFLSEPSNIILQDGPGILSKLYIIYNYR